MISWRHPHNGWQSFWGFLTSYILFLSPVWAQDTPGTTANPTNNTRDLSQQVGSLRFLLQSNQLQFPSPIHLAPLTQPLATLGEGSFAQFNSPGELLSVTPSNSATVNNTDIALISCDPSEYPGVLSAGVTVANVIQSQPNLVAIILYSTQSDHCNYTINDPNFDYSYVFTVLGANSSYTIQDQLSSHPNSTSSNIVPDMSTASSGSVSGGTDSGSSSLTGASPTTAVAMIILYSITGIITALFLGIIITGAIRAHRNPERYGPRNVIGRPRQSRARGIARAMLETIPIVKFGDSNQQRVDAVKGDVELASGIEGDGPEQTDRTENTRNPASNEGETGHSLDMPSDGNNPKHSHDDAPPAAAESVTSLNQEHPNDFGNNVCPICTDDFIKGQDVRVLPCNHQFHPECIDPWLINVSGTCPLCRIDLNPAEAAAEREEDDGDGDGTERQDHIGNVRDAAPARSSNMMTHRGLSSYLPDIRRMHNAPVEERIAALRRLRQSSEVDRNAIAAAEAEEATEESQRHRRRMTQRLREHFRIRTRQHDDQADQADHPPTIVPSYSSAI